MFRVIVLLSVAIGLNACCTGNSCSPGTMDRPCGCDKNKETY
jgi:hypothetical protein